MQLINFQKVTIHINEVHFAQIKGLWACCFKSVCLSACLSVHLTANLNHNFYLYKVQCSYQVCAHSLSPTASCDINTDHLVSLTLTL